jgi:membrane-bound lytic murein transglycosylase D
MNPRNYRYLLAVALLLVLAGALAGALALRHKLKRQDLRAEAVSTFYAMKAFEEPSDDPDPVAAKEAVPLPASEILARRDRARALEKKYDSLLQELDFSAGVSPEDRIIMRVARSFGECELTMPKDFPGRVKQGMARWKSSPRLQEAFSRAQQKGYLPLIAKLLKQNGLPPHYLFIVLQESDFDERAVGPATRYGTAKGLWQFLGPTARYCGLQVGPLQDKPVYDPRDERFDPAKSTIAACRYLKSLSRYAQTSGLLVLALYHMAGTSKEVIGRLPPTPRERNSWRLLSLEKVPGEIYDYVFSVVAAAVLCENPKLFGLDCPCPAFGVSEETPEAAGRRPTSEKPLPGKGRTGKNADWHRAVTCVNMAGLMWFLSGKSSLSTVPSIVMLDSIQMEQWSTACSNSNEQLSVWCRAVNQGEER